MPAHVGELGYPRFLFSETQRFPRPLRWILPGIVSGIPAILIIYAYSANPRLHIVFVLTVLAVCMIFPAMMIFIGLRVIVTSEQLVIDFFPLRRKVIALSEIESAVAENYHPIKEFGGWGWRSSLRGSTKVYSMSGNRGVRITLRSGQHIMIGSQRADELAEAVIIHPV